MKGKELYEIIGMIDEDLVMEANKEAKVMKRSKIKVTAIVAAAIVVLGAATGVMGRYILGSTSSHSSIFPDYTEVPDAETLMEDVGFETNIVEEFSNGYVFNDARIVEGEHFDTEGNSVEQYEAINCEYERDGDRISFDADASVGGDGAGSNSELVESYNGTDIYYYSYMNKFVPGDYQLTEQDKIDEAAGRYVFSYGSSEIEVSQVQGATWHHDGVNYSLCAIDSTVTKAELTEMAEEIIEAQ